MKISKIVINALSSSIQVIITGFVYFFLYRYLLKSLGSSQLGIWSLVLATSSIASLANFGITSGLVKFIADYNAKGEEQLIGKTVYTATISIIILISSVCLLMFFLGGWILQKVVHDYDLILALAVLPYSMMCLLINTLSGVFTSVLEGLQKNYLKNIVYGISSVVLIVLAYLLVPKYGLKGVAFAQIIQAVFILITSFILSLKYFSIRVFFNRSWDRSIFKNLFGYGIKFQAISIAQMLYEPTTKMLLGKFGGLDFLGFYEMASRLVMQLRSVIVSANQVMIPVVAQANVLNKQKIKEIYTKSMSFLLLFNILFVVVIIISAPLVSILWIGHLQSTFVISVYILSVSMFINILCGPAYFSFLGEGDMNILLVTHLFMAIANISLGYFGGQWLMGTGVILAWAVSLSIGSWWCMHSYQRKNKIKYSDFLHSQDSVLILISILLTIGFSWLFWNELKLEKLAIYTFITLIIFIPFLFTHTATKQLLKRFW